ncbi:hypothetical protein BKA81DRAFT_352582 [Phyllosticta paracitricarpa]
MRCSLSRCPSFWKLHALLIFLILPAFEHKTTPSSPVLVCATAELPGSQQKATLNHLLDPLRSFLKRYCVFGAL